MSDKSMQKSLSDIVNEVARNAKVLADVQSDNKISLELLNTIYQRVEDMSRKFDEVLNSGIKKPKLNPIKKDAVTTVEEEEEEKDTDPKKKKKGNMKVSQPLQQQQINMANPVNQALFNDGTSISSLPTQEQTNYDNMYQKDDTPLVGAFEPVAANDGGVSAFGGW